MKDKVIAKQKKKEKPILGIQPYGYVEVKYLTLIKNKVENYFDFKVVILPTKEMPVNAFYHPRNRYRADSLIRILKRETPDTLDRVMGITHKDISTSKGGYEDYGIMGLGFCPGKSCVISLYRLKRYSKGDVSKFKKYMLVTSLHEISHTLGLPHCEQSENCLLIDSRGGLRTIKQGEPELCKSCKEKLANKGFRFSFE